MWVGVTKPENYALIPAAIQFLRREGLCCGVLGCAFDGPAIIAAKDLHAVYGMEGSDSAVESGITFPKLVCTLPVASRKVNVAKKVCIFCQTNQILLPATAWLLGLHSQALRVKPRPPLSV